MCRKKTTTGYVIRGKGNFVVRLKRCEINVNVSPLCIQDVVPINMSDIPNRFIVNGF